MLENFIVISIVLPFLIIMWLFLFLLIKVVIDTYGIDLSVFLNRKEVDIPDFVTAHRNSEIEYLFNERRKNDNQIQI